MPLPEKTVALLKKLAADTGIKEATINAIYTMSLYDDGSNNKIPLENRENINALILALVQNQDLAARLNPDVFSNIGGPFGGISIDAGFIRKLQNISFGTRHLHQLEPQMERINNTFNKYHNKNNPILEKEKISLKDYGILYDLAQSHSIIHGLKNKGLLDGEEQLEKLHQQSAFAYKMIKEMDQSFNADFKMPTGTIFFHQTKKYIRELTLFQRLMNFFVTKFFHLSHGKTGQAEVAHLVRSERTVHGGKQHYKNDKISLLHFLYSDVYKIKLENLMSNKVKELCKKHLGPEWLGLIEEYYEDIEHEIHNYNRKNGYYLVLDHGFIRYFRLALSWLQGGHKNLFSKDHKNTDVRDDVLGRGKWRHEGKRAPSNMICSEFVGKTTIASIQELNDHLRKELSAKGVQKIPRTLIKNPLSKKEKLYLLTPERMLDALIERGAVERVSPPESIRQLVNENATQDASDTAPKLM